MIRNFFRKLMYGRYGPDQLNVCMLFVSITLSMSTWFMTGENWAIPYMVVSILTYALVALAIFRMFSRNVRARQKENAVFLRLWGKIKWRVKRLFGADRQHRYFKCPSCKNTLRLPRGKGKIQITCPKCGQRFVKKT